MHVRLLLLPLGLVACSQPAIHSSNPAGTATGEASSPAPTNPRPYDEWRLRRWLDENGNPPAPNQKQLARAEAKANAAHWDAIDDGGIGRHSWTERGPSNMGGRTRALVIHPTTPSRMWAGSVGGGIWRSDNSGGSWYPLDDWMGNLAICCLTMDPGNSNVMYAGTGEGFGNFDAISGEGIWKTTNGGSSWTQIASTLSFGSVNRIVVSPSNSNVVLAATATGIRRSTDGGTSWTTERTGNSLQVVVNPNNANNYVAHVSESGVHRVVRSTDGGLNWTNATTGLTSVTGRIELAFATSFGNRIYASTNVSGGDIWRSDDAGANWTQRTATGLSGGQIWYNDAIWVDPTNSNIVVVGYQDMFRSTDGGATFTTISNGGMNASTPHSDVHFFTADPGYDGSTNKTVYVCTDGGVYRTTDITAATTSSGWVRRDSNYRTIQYHGVAGHGSGRIAGGTQDNGTHELEFGSQVATLVRGADGGFTAIDPTNDDFIFGETQNMGLFRSSDGGASYVSISAGISDVGSCTNFIPPLVLDHNDPNRLLAGGCSLWRTTNAKTGSPPSWTNIKASIGSNISAIAVAPGNSAVIWVGHNNGHVYRTSNGTAASPTWTAVDNNSSPNPLPSRSVERILIDRTSTSTVFVCFGGFSTNNLWRTTNNGSTFTDVTGSGVTGLPSAPLYGIAQHPSLNGRYYVASEVGVFGTSDNCANWSTSNDGPADVSCIEIGFMHGSSTLLVGTHGRGMWSTTINEPAISSVGAGCAGTSGTPALAATAPRIGTSVSVTASNLVANQPVWLVQGTSSASWWGNSLPFDLLPFGAGGCFLRVSADIVRDGLSTAGGTFATSIAIAANTGLLGRNFHLQLFPGDPTANAWGRTASNALRLTIGN
jgi:hypothetical protein